jgi:hypothetical protein
VHYVQITALGFLISHDLYLYKSIFARQAFP